MLLSSRCSRVNINPSISPKAVDPQFSKVSKNENDMFYGDKKGQSVSA